MTNWGLSPDLCFLDLTWESDDTDNYESTKTFSGAFLANQPSFKDPWVIWNCHCCSSIWHEVNSEQKKEQRAVTVNDADIWSVGQYRSSARLRGSLKLLACKIAESSKPNQCQGCSITNRANFTKSAQTLSWWTKRMQPIKFYCLISHTT